MKDEDKFDKDFDLEASEFRKEEEPEPFFGWGAPPNWNLFFLQLVGAVAVGVLVSYLINGQLPYWLQHLRQ